jgi:hypothetical protein
MERERREREKESEVIKQQKGTTVLERGGPFISLSLQISGTLFILRISVEESVCVCVKILIVCVCVCLLGEERERGGEKRMKFLCFSLLFSPFLSDSIGLYFVIAQLTLRQVLQLIIAVVHSAGKGVKAREKSREESMERRMRKG